MTLWTQYINAIEASGRDEVLVGRIHPRIKRQISDKSWLSADNLRKAGLNAIQIAEQILKIHHLD